MVVADLEQARAVLGKLIAKSKRIVAFTGAGISTECGVPDFRSPDSPWRRNRPIDFSQFMAEPLMREEAWRRKFAIDDASVAAKPGRGHRALANLVASGRLTTIITQNIDTLHQASGVPEDQIVELHGNATHALCMRCGLRHELAPIRSDFEATGAAPECVRCGGPVKSATISFGQPMPQAALQRAYAATVACDLFLAIGSSLVVYPAASFPLLARQAAACLIIVNGEATPLDSQADLVLRGDIGDILTPLG